MFGFSYFYEHGCTGIFTRVIQTKKIQNFPLHLRSTGPETSLSELCAMKTIGKIYMRNVRYGVQKSVSWQLLGLRSIFLTTRLSWQLWGIFLSLHRFPCTYLHITNLQIPKSQVIRSSVESLGVINLTEVQVVKEKYNTSQPAGMYMTVFLHFADESWLNNGKFLDFACRFLGWVLLQWTSHNHPRRTHWSTHCLV